MEIHKGLCKRQAREYFKKNKPFYLTTANNANKKEAEIYIDKEYKKKNGINDFEELCIIFCNKCTKKEYGGYPVFFEKIIKEDISWQESIRRSSQQENKKSKRKGRPSKKN